MATLSELRATIVDDLIASTIQVTDAHVDAAIKGAIRALESERYWFNDSRDLTFSCVVDQTEYTEGNVALVIKPEFLTLELDNGQERHLTYCRPNTLSWLLEGDPSSGEPTSWTWFGIGFRLSPPPDDTYTIRVTGFAKYAALSVDTDTNDWITEGKGYDLVRARAKWILSTDITKDDAEATRAAAAEEVARTTALNKTGLRYGRGMVTPRQF